MIVTNIASALLNLVAAHTYYIKHEKAAEAEVVGQQIITLYNCQERGIKTQVEMLVRENFITDGGKLLPKGRKEILPISSKVCQEEFLDTVYSLTDTQLNALFATVVEIVANKVRENGISVLTDNSVDALMDLDSVIEQNSTPFINTGVEFDEESMVEENMAEVIAEVAMA